MFNPMGHMRWLYFMGAFVIIMTLMGVAPKLSAFSGEESHSEFEQKLAQAVYAEAVSQAEPPGHEHAPDRLAREVDGAAERVRAQARADAQPFLETREQERRVLND